MKRVERLTALIAYLESRSYSPVKRLVERFQVSERTMYRDLASLQEIGVPIAFEANRGYHILDRHFVPPVSFTEEEAVALTLAGSLMTYHSDEKTRAHFEGAMEKIRCALNNGQQALVENLSETLRTYPNLSKSHAENYLSQVQQAVIRKQILKISYLDRKQAFSTREIEPIGLSFYSNQWHTVAWCWKRRAYRDFIVSSIQELCPTFLPFRKQDHLSMDEYIATLIQNMQNH